MNDHNKTKGQLIDKMMDNIISYSTGAAENICGILRDDPLVSKFRKQRLNSIMEFEVAWEFICFYVHLIDRFTMNRQDDKARLSLVANIKENTDKFFNRANNKEIANSLKKILFKVFIFGFLLDKMSI